MSRRNKWIASGAIAAVVIVAASGIAVATGGGDGEGPLTGSVLEQAAAAALAHTGGGTVVDSEVGDGGSGYEVEVRLDDGSVVEVQLDGTFAVTGSETDDEGADTQEGERDD